MKRIAAIDFGHKRIGIALSDAQQKLALPWKSAEGGRRAVENVMALLLPMKEELERILVGYPLLLSGKVGEMAKETELFAKKLEAALSLPVELCDERLSSRQAERELQSLSFSRKERKGKVDMSAAALFLQSYLDKKNSALY
ncbi:MAG: Holliday junction resolvase RuvX [Verrucomicrobiota bacterium]|nr:Holliday junction resolvase RuvX [Verrucomicrobiota bacterium]